MRAARLLGAMLLLLPSAAIAQTTQLADPAAATGVQYLSRFTFHFGAERLSSDDPRFVWDANYGGDVDLVDYKAGRAVFFANYQVILGNELRDFDPNQGNYILGFRLSARLHALEVSAVFHHQSRHLSDREKEEPVDWNMLGMRLSRSFVVKKVALDARADIRWVTQKSFVDYNWEIEGAAHAEYPFTPHIALVGDVIVRHVGVDGSADRGGQTGARGEGGVRLSGRGAAVDLYVAAERRIDPYPLEFGVGQWWSMGFRFVH